MVDKKDKAALAKEKRLQQMTETMKEVWALNDKGLLSSTDLTMILCRVQHKYKLSPLKHCPRH